MGFQNEELPWRAQVGVCFASTIIYTANFKAPAPRSSQPWRQYRASVFLRDTTEKATACHVPYELLFAALIKCNFLFLF